MINKFIEKLGEQADDYTDDKIQMHGEYHPDWHSVRDHKFAELLIKEIVSELQLEIHRSCRTLTYDLDDHIKMDAREDALDDAMLIVKSILE